MRRPTVDPAFTFGISLVVSLVLWWPTLRALLDGNVDITDAGLRYLGALALSWCGVYFVASLVAMYASQPPPEPPRPPRPPHPLRRAEDRAGSGVPPAGTGGESRDVPAA
ncbi:MAG: hypothetical protein KatS3mg009_0341 [Acidimicrobiia bacterium]|nr:MAG: hypothetical protein KatS3mg009_0341 [Acidimicrobiia bacterium]